MLIKKLPDWIKLGLKDSEERIHAHIHVFVTHTHSHTQSHTHSHSAWLRCPLRHLAASPPPAAVWSLWVGRSVVLFCCTFCLCLPVVGVKGGSDTRSRVMDRRPRKRESDIETHRGRGREPGVSFVASAVKAQQGEPPWQFVSGATLSFFFFFFPVKAPSSLLAVTSSRLRKLWDKSFTVTRSPLTPLIYPACLWLLAPAAPFLYSRSNLKICGNYMH